jgi:hypothetical protein
VPNPNQPRRPPTPSRDRLWQAGTTLQAIEDEIEEALQEAGVEE